MTVSLLLHCVLLSLLVSTQIYLEERRRKEEARKIEKKKKRGRDAEEQSATLPPILCLCRRHVHPCRS